MKNKIIYVAGKYRDRTPYRIEQNISDAMSVALACWQLGYPTICPHGNTRLFDGEVSDTDILKGLITVLKRCDILIMTYGWEDSEGSVMERTVAKREGLVVFDCFYDFLKCLEHFGSDLVYVA